MKGWLELRHLPRRVWTLSAAALVNRAGTMALPFLTLYLTSALGWSASRAAAVLGVYGAVALVAGPWAGRLSDRWGAAQLARTSLAAAGALAVVLPLARSPWAVVAMTIAWAVFSEAFRPANMTALAESAPAGQRKQAFALHRAAINLGMSVGPAAGGFIAARSYTGLWLIDGLTSLIAAAVLWRWLGASGEAAAASEAGPSVSALEDRRMRWFLLGLLVQSVVFFQLESSLPLYIVRSLRASPAFYGLLFTVNTLIIVAVEIPLNHATAHWSHRRTLVTGATLIGLGFGAYGLAHAVWSFVAATVVWTFGEMILMPGASAYVSAVAPEDRRGEYMGLHIMAFNVGFMAGPWLGTAVFESAGWPTLWAGCLVVGLFAAALLSLIPVEPAQTGVAAAS